MSIIHINLSVYLYIKYTIFLHKRQEKIKRKRRGGSLPLAPATSCFRYPLCGDTPQRPEKKLSLTKTRCVPVLFDLSRLI